MYKIFKEQGIGPLTKKVEPDVIKDGNRIGYTNTLSQVELSLEGQRLTIRANGEPVRVIMEAEPLRERPWLTATLDEKNPEIGTTRRNITIISHGGKRKLIVAGEVFKPMTMSSSEVAAMQMGMRAMQGNVADAFDRGQRSKTSPSA